MGAVRLGHTRKALPHVKALPHARLCPRLSPRKSFNSIPLAQISFLLKPRETWTVQRALLPSLAMALVERQERRLVIAIDYGTTYTGIPRPPVQLDNLAPD